MCWAPPFSVPGTGLLSGQTQPFKKPWHLYSACTLDSSIARSRSGEDLLRRCGAVPPRARFSTIERASQPYKSAGAHSHTSASGPTSIMSTDCTAIAVLGRTPVLLASKNFAKRATYGRRARRVVVTAGNGTHAFSPASLLCRDALTTELLATSESNDWRSVLVEHHDILSREEPFETRSTPDQTLVVMTRGQQELESLQAGRWRRATYAAGTMGTTPGGMSDRLRRRRVVHRDLRG